MSSFGPADNSQPQTQFAQVINLVRQPYSKVVFEEPGFSGQLRQSPPQVFSFEVLKQGPGGDFVTFSAHTDAHGNPQDFSFVKGDMICLPSKEVGRKLFMEQVIQPLHNIFFGRSQLPAPSNPVTGTDSSGLDLKG